jgi:hypothetical protein
LKQYRIRESVIIFLSSVLGFSSLASAQSSPDTEARAIIGLEQSGASATKAEQHFFFDFFIDRKLKHDWVSLWGNIRIASFPQQIDTGIAQFAADFANQVGAIRVNELAESADFATGLDFHPAGLKWDVGEKAERRLGFIFSVGASGPFEPTSRLRLFKIPDKASTQYARFVKEFPEASAAGVTHIGFIPPDRLRFYRAWGAGIRLTTHYFADDKKTESARAPATYSFTLGQDENVAGGSLKGWVAKFDVFYPLPITGNGSRFIYLFGNGNMRVAGASNITPFVLAGPDPGITGTEPSVAIVARPSNRDSYRLGVGIDAVGLACAIRPVWCK